MGMPSQCWFGGVYAEAEVIPIEKATGTLQSKISTGICFLDHMIDQLTSHGMLGVTLRCGIKESMEKTRMFSPLQDYAAGVSGRPHDSEIFDACGTALGCALRRVIDEFLVAETHPSCLAVFCCPLDEAFAEVTLDLQPAPEQQGRCVLSLEPYGKFASKSGGRQWIGRYRTDLTPTFWSSLTKAMRCDLALRKVRGGNAHHVLESTFKSFARAFRAALDQAIDGRCHGCAKPGAGPAPPSAPAIESR